MTTRDRLAAALAESMEANDDDITGDWLGDAGLYIDGLLAADPDLAADAELGAAWRLAEAALPEGWYLQGVRRRYIGERGKGKGWSASAVEGGLPTEARRHGTVKSLTGHGPTPTAALLALRDRLVTGADG